MIEDGIHAQETSSSGSTLVLAEKRAVSTSPWTSATSWGNGWSGSTRFLTVTSGTPSTRSSLAAKEIQMPRRW